jgi:hypothetical protein
VRKLTAAILTFVLRFVAALTLAAFTLLVCVDKVCCPDGCTERSGTASTESVPHNAAHTCVLCVLGVETPMAPLPLKPLALVSIVPATTVGWLPVRAPLPPEYPPRNV